MKKLLLSLALACTLANPALISADTITLTSGSTNKRSYQLSELIEKAHLKEILEKLKEARPAFDMAFGTGVMALVLANTPYTPIRNLPLDMLIGLGGLSLANHGYNNLKPHSLSTIRKQVAEQLRKLAKKLDTKAA